MRHTSRNNRAGLYRCNCDTDYRAMLGRRALRGDVMSYHHFLLAATLHTDDWCDEIYFSELATKAQHVAYLDDEMGYPLVIAPCDADFHAVHQ